MKFFLYSLRDIKILYQNIFKKKKMSKQKKKDDKQKKNKAAN